MSAMADENWPVRWRDLENWAISMALGAIVVLPLAEAVLRITLHRGLAGSNAFVQHLTLVIGMLGGAIAARENRLLALSNLGNHLKGRWKACAGTFCGVAAAAFSFLLAVAAVQFVFSQRQAGAHLSWGIPVWVVQAVLPLGFAAVSLRLLRHAVETWRGRLGAALLAGALVLLAARGPLAPQTLVLPALVVLLAATVLGVPAFVTLGGGALILFWGQSQPIASLPIDHYSLVINPSLPAMPLFTLAGYFLAEGGAPARLVRVFRAWFGWFAGGTAIVTALACAFFTSFTGASGITIIAIGGLLMPVLLEERYRERTALGLVTGAGSLGLLFPPCLPLILYAVVARIPIDHIFLGGILPGLILVAAVAGWGVWAGPRGGARPRQPFRWPEAVQALRDAKYELLLPVLVFAALFGGFATPVEAAALTALYTFIISVFVHRDLSLRKDLPRVMSECGLLVGGVLLILGVALGLTNYLTDIQVTARAVEWTTSTIHSRWAFLLALNLFLLIVGCLMDIYSAIVIQVPLLVPLGQAYGIDPVHLGIIFLANLELGYLTPPVGLNLFLSSYRFKKPLGEVLWSVLPIVLVLLGGVLLITYVPALTTLLPRWWGSSR